MMILFLLAVFAAPVIGADLTQLGVMTDRRAIILERSTERPDHAFFRVELQALGWPSNTVQFVKTNALLTMNDFSGMTGPCIMAVHSVCSDGGESGPALFRLDVRRDPPDRPTAKMIWLLNTNRATSTTRDLRLLRTNMVVEPQAPSMTLGITNDRGSLSQTLQAEPLPNSRNETYEQYVLRMQRMAAEGVRRSQ